MAFPYMIGPGGQPFLIQQVNIIQQQPILAQAQPQLPQQHVPVQQKVPDYMSEERLQEKGKDNKW